MTLVMIVALLRHRCSPCSFEADPSEMNPSFRFLPFFFWEIRVCKRSKEYATAPPSHTRCGFVPSLTSTLAVRLVGIINLGT